ncbi:hypothetical protein IF1G_08547 [Cordyceps javanica]|uniref:Uncharacterized protein n=1 Tax=Cordyceps javanica TaxID=43265 RepID=A0A545UT35_9HYPO|nr:hypothetical protein IF1G_08547 [Cordyceps javanica]
MPHFNLVLEGGGWRGRLKEIKGEEGVRAVGKENTNTRPCQLRGDGQGPGQIEEDAQLGALALARARAWQRMDGVCLMIGSDRNPGIVQGETRDKKPVATGFDVDVVFYFSRALPCLSVLLSVNLPWNGERHVPLFSVLTMPRRELAMGFALQHGEKNAMVQTENEGRDRKRKEMAD